MLAASLRGNPRMSDVPPRRQSPALIAAPTSVLVFPIPVRCSHQPRRVLLESAHPLNSAVRHAALTRRVCVFPEVRVARLARRAAMRSGEVRSRGGRGAQPAAQRVIERFADQ